MENCDFVYPGIVQDKGISFEDARKKVQSMNLINGFMFDSVIENEDSAKKVVGAILRRVLNRDIADVVVTSQKIISGIDVAHHGIRLDAFVSPSGISDGSVIITVYDVEMEDRPSDRPSLPRRRRYYTGLSDSKWLATNNDYRYLPEYISVTILSYDPFLRGDMYYVAKKQLITHPEYSYEDGILDIYLYAYGKPNHPDKHYSQKLQEMLKYIVTGEKPINPDNDIDSIDEIVTAVKRNAEVTREYMEQWDRERSIQIEAELETKKKDAIILIQFARENEISEEKIKESLKTRFGLDDMTIEEVFEMSK